MPTFQELNLRRIAASDALRLAKTKIVPGGNRQEAAEHAFALKALADAEEEFSEVVEREVADLWFHSMLALSAHGLAPADVLAELWRREGLSGLEEFAARRAQSRDEEEKKT